MPKREGVPFSGMINLKLKFLKVCRIKSLKVSILFFFHFRIGSKSYCFSLSKLEKLSSESEELKEASLDDKLESLIVCS